MTTSLPHTRIRIRDLSELVAGIPYVLGFPPTDSLVLFTFRRCPDLALSTTIRVDLPTPELIPPVVADLAGAVDRNEAVAAIAVVVDNTGRDHRLLIETLRKTLAHKEVLLTHASLVRKVAHGEKWQCYDDPLCTGTVPDPRTSALAAAIAVAGDTIYPSREAMAAHLAPDSEEALARRRELLNAYRSAAQQPYSEEDLTADLQTLGHALDAVMASRALPTLTDDELARLGIALSRTEVKDECLAIALSDESEPAERLWTVLVRALPAPERAEPAFLLGISSYLRGSGVIAALALKITMEANPEHRMAVLLDYALQIGTPPDLLRSMIMTSVVRNHEAVPGFPLDDDPPWDTEEALHTEQRDDRDLARTEQPSQEPTPSPEQAAEAEGIPVGHVTTVDPLAAFLPPPTERSEPG
ncbi:DUF4192 domain-containing protein [Actinophytocola sp.]|uniref:DUF4192 domain-containing protein n=1 Tax=Actinophytocola sp. TaxID=1872138 RepID=UPI002ED3F4FF